MRRLICSALMMAVVLSGPVGALAWHDQTHLAIAKAAGYHKWFNAAGADMIKVKAGWIESMNHAVNNPRGTTVTKERVLGQVDRYDKPGDGQGRLYGAIIASIRNYLAAKKRGKYGEYHLAFAAHYIGDLSQPLHNTLYNTYNRKHHAGTDNVINLEVMDHLERIRIYDIQIRSEVDLAREIARIADLSIALGYRLEDEKRLLTKGEAFRQISHSASLFRAVLKYVGKD